MKITTDTLCFEVNEEGSQAVLSAPGTEMQYAGGSFWEITMQQPVENIDEIHVFSNQQKGSVYADSEKSVRIVYHKLQDTYGDEYDVGLTVFIRSDGQLLHFKCLVENRRPGIRVLESMCPVMCFHNLCGVPEEDVFFMPSGLGRRLRNPWASNTSQQGSLKAYAHHHPSWTWSSAYPGDCCMAWMGVQTGDYFLYVGRHDPKIRLCGFRIQVPPLLSNTRQMLLTAAHLPSALCGECVETPETSVGLLRGDWRRGAAIYHRFAYSTFFQPSPKQEWVRRMNGIFRLSRQGIMCPSDGLVSGRPNVQRGGQLHTYDRISFEDLPGLYLEGKKYGIDILLLFTWWDTPFNTDFPNHSISEENAERLRKAIRQVRELGGKVLLMCNATYVNVQSAYYRKYGDEVSHLDSCGNLELALHGWASSVWLSFNPYHRYVHGCCSSKRWRDTLLAHGKRMVDMDPDGLFYDCFGAWSSGPCFNALHDHGNRVDEQWTGRRQVYDSVRSLCGEKYVFSNEVITDIAASYTQFIHSLAYNPYDDESYFPAMFRYTFPDVIITNRFMNNEQEDFDRQLRWDFVMGMRYDVGEVGGFIKEKAARPRYAQVIAEMNQLRQRYAEFIMDGRFTVREAGALPRGVTRGEYETKDGRRLRILYNATDEWQQVVNVRLQPDEMRFDIFPSDEEQVRG